MKIAVFSPDFTDAVAALIVPIQREEFGIPISSADQPDLQNIPDFYQRGAGGFWVALDGDTVVGTIALLDLGGDEGALRKMFVAAAYRGALYGTARLLLETLLNHARTHNLRTIYLGTTDKFLAAHRFYEKHGFEVVDADLLPSTFPRMSVDSRFYRISLSD
jgi:N-acetylglutamate synthase-like GNAT family acetyltransferase